MSARRSRISGIASSSVATARGLSARALCVVLLGQSAVGCGSSEPIVIRPKSPRPHASVCPRAASTFRLVSIEDRRGYGDQQNVGFTQTGLYNVLASLRTRPAPAALLGDSLSQALASCRLMASAAPGYRDVRVELLTFQLTETTGFTSETIVADLKYEVEVSDPATKRVLRRFVVRAVAEDSGLDTTDSAPDVATGAIAKSLPRFLLGVGAVPRTDSTMPPAPPAPVGVQLFARQLTHKQEEQAFSTTLHDKAILAVEVVVRRTRGAPHPLRFRRHHFRAGFVDGSMRYPLDPLKLRERNRIGVPVYGYSAGVFFPAGNYNVEGKTEGLEKSIEEVEMAAATPEFKGLLLFDLAGIQKPLLARIDVDFEDATTSQRHDVWLVMRTPSR